MEYIPCETIIVTFADPHHSWKYFSSKIPDLHLQAESCHIWKYFFQPYPITICHIFPDSQITSGTTFSLYNLHLQADPGHFWNYFFSLLATIIMLLVIKARARQPDDDFEQVEVYFYCICSNT